VLARPITLRSRGSNPAPAISKMTNTLETKIRFDVRNAHISEHPKNPQGFFDGGVTMQDADQYVSNCEGGGVNLHSYKIGRYVECSGCKSQTKCIASAHCAGEQADP